MIAYTGVKTVPVNGKKIIKPPRGLTPEGFINSDGWLIESLLFIKQWFRILRGGYKLHGD